MIVLTILAFAPGLFWLWYFYRKDRLEPEPKKLILKMFLLGLGIFFPAALLESPFVAMRPVLVLLVAPIVEEALKYLVVWRVIYRDREFDEPMDGIIYAATVALGFASIENLIYLIEALNSGVFLTTYVLRAVLSVPGHVLFSAMWGYALGLAKYSQRKSRNQIILQGFILSVVLHGLFNFIATVAPVFAVGMLIFAVIMWRMVNKRIAAAFRISRHAQSHLHEPKVQDFQEESH